VHRGCSRAHGTREQLVPFVGDQRPIELHGETVRQPVQVSFAPFHEVIAEHLRFPPEEVTAFGMSMGFGDPDAPVNRPAMPRERVSDFARIAGFPEGPSGR
jgi:hypothetical protein